MQVHGSQSPQLAKKSRVSKKKLFFSGPTGAAGGVPPASWAGLTSSGTTVAVCGLARESVWSSGAAHAAAGGRRDWSKQAER